MEPYTLVAGHEDVVAAFGHWPGFDEAEVLRLILDSTRLDVDGNRFASIDLELRAWHVMDDGTGTPVFDGHRSSAIHFLFEHVYDLSLDGLNH